MRILKDLETETKEIEQILKDLAEYYFTPLTQRQIEMYTEDLVEIGSKEVAEAAKAYRQSQWNKKFPLPAVLKTQIKAKQQLKSLRKQVLA